MPNNSIDVTCKNGNKLADIIVKDKVSLCRQQNINFKIIGRYQNLRNLEAASISIMFSNLLNTAIDMCVNMPNYCKSKYINLMFVKKEIDCCEIIYIENSYSSKAKNRLNGIDVVKEEVGLYQGKFKEKYNDYMHMVEIRFPICY